jgi:hypothetical protein
MNTYLIHVDTGSLQRSVTKAANNPFDCTYIMANHHRCLRAVKLMNVQLPIGWYNIRSPYNAITIDSTTYTIPPGNYTIAALISALNTLITAGVGAFSVSAVTNLVTYTPFSGSSTITTGTIPTLGTLLGFTSGQSGTTIVSTNSYNINFDTYVSVYIPNIGTSSMETNLCTFKIPIGPTAQGATVYWAEKTQDTQIVNVTDSSVMVDRFIIKVFDRYGQPMNNNGVDWSFTMEIKSVN